MALGTQKIITLALLNRRKVYNGDVYVESLKKALNENVSRAIRLQLVLIFLPSHMYLLTKPYLIHMSSSFLSCLIAPLSYCFYLSLSFLPLFQYPVTVQTSSHPAVVRSVDLCGLVWRESVFVHMSTSVS